MKKYLFLFTMLVSVLVSTITFGEEKVTSQPMIITGYDVNERKGPGTEYEIVTSHILEEIVNVTGREGDWFKLENGNYIHSSLLKAADGTSAYEIKELFETRYARNDNVNVYSEPDINSEITRVMQIAEPIHVTGKIENTWYKTEYGFIEKINTVRTIQDIVVDSMEKYNDIIIVCISKQMVYYYQDKQIITQGECVTGNVSTTPTPTGLYKVQYKEQDTYLMNNSFVHYFIAFNGGIGLHDASWRYGCFGGDIYTYDGSHGCVNLEYDVAEKIYNNASVESTRVLVLP
jgi:uncharacterized protein YgiM (DUF1202 family)